MYKIGVLFCRGMPPSGGTALARPYIYNEVKSQVQVDEKELMTVLGHFHYNDDFRGSRWVLGAAIKISTDS